MIRQTGTAEQIEELEARLAAHQVDEEALRREIEYTRKVNTPPEQPGQDDEHLRAMRFVVAKLGSSRQGRPEAITYEHARTIFWNTYRQLVFHETGIEVKTLDKRDAAFIRNFVHWMIGSPAGEWDPRKSLFLWGNLGTGKTTIAHAGHLVMSYYRHAYGWKERHYQFISMDELFLETYTSQSLEAIGALAKGNWCLDELRTEHLTYKHYGNDLSILADVLTARHNLWKRTGATTIITSNMNPRSLVAIGDRIYDRVAQQYQPVELIGSNKRHPVNRLKNS